MSMKFEQKI